MKCKITYYAVVPVIDHYLGDVPYCQKNTSFSSYKEALDYATQVAIPALRQDLEGCVVEPFGDWKGWAIEGRGKRHEEPNGTLSNINTCSVRHKISFEYPDGTDLAGHIAEIAKTLDIIDLEGVVTHLFDPASIEVLLERGVKHPSLDYGVHKYSVESEEAVPLGANAYPEQTLDINA